MAVIGIDLGTTNSLAAVWRNGCSELIPNAFGEVLTPSVVSVDEAGTVFVGKTAKERLISHPECTACVFKRFMGTEKVYKLGQKSYTPEELSSFVLRKLREDAENYLKETVTEAVVSVPAYFNNAQRDATKRAGELAGLVVKRIINEPSAAALACQHLYPEEETVELVFDFGGGTLDVSVVDCFDNIINVVSVSGDNHLGGCDFDRAMAEYFCREQGMELKKLSLSEQAAVLKSAEACKIALSDAEQAEMTVHYGGETRTLFFDTEKMIQASAGIFKRLIEPLKQAVLGAELKWEDINRIILVGGSCNMPAVRLYLQHFLKKEAVFLGSPDTIVALGTGTYAGIKERKAEIRDMLLTDVCPFTLGVEIKDGVMSPIIERNSALPVSRSRKYVTISDFQKILRFAIYQGEAPVAEDNILLGEIEVPVPPALAEKEAAEVRFTYDINGILEVDARVLSTNETRHLVIIDRKNRMSQAQIQETLEEMQKLKIHPREREENAYLLSRCESLYAQAGSGLREFLLDQMQYFQFLLETQNDLKIKKGREYFTRALDAAEDSMAIFRTEEEFRSFSDRWYEEAKQEEADGELDADLDAWLGKGHLTS